MARPPYTWEDATGVERVSTKSIVCPHQCTKCAKYPSEYGTCPTGYTRNNTTGCCDSTGGLACTTPSFNNSCSYPTVYNPANGLCCSSGSTCSSGFASKCFSLGGDYDPLSCTCSGCDTCGG